MKTVTSFPHATKHLEHVWIPMSDGTRLAARIWMPEDAENNPVPAILEYIPYRKRDNTRSRDALNHPYFAGHGYASIRVDIRGSGDSEGVLQDEYLQRELDDGVEIIRWIAQQDWCSGSVGMIGISWGGFNGLQIAALRPPELKAVISVCSTDDRYADDVHYMGGCMLTDNLSWASTMFAYTSLPPDPELVGEKWRDMWLDRLEHSGLWLENWLEHQRRDDFWRHGSICEDFSAVQCPVMAVSGWADGYSNSVFRLLSNLDVPTKGLIGPWSHMYPHMGKPGPAIGFLQESVRWWDHWLKGKDTGIMDEPDFRVWMQDSVPPATEYTRRPGRWIAEPGWPSSNVHETVYGLSEGHLVDPGTPVSDTPLWIQSPLSLGLFAGKWCSYSATPDLPHDQREEDGGALVFDTEPLSEPLEIMGAPVIELELEANKPQAMICVRLSDLAPDNKATRSTYGMLNLSHRDSHAEPSPMVPGERYRVAVQLNDIAQRFPAGHRLRISISTSYWPLAWPAPELACLTVHPTGSRLRLPVRPSRDSDAALPEFGEPESAAAIATPYTQAPEQNWRVIRDLSRDESILEVIKNDGTFTIEEIGLTMWSDTREWYTHVGEDFESMRGETHCVSGMARGDWSIEVTTRTVLTASRSHFHVYAELDAYEGDERVVARNWNTHVPRDHL